MKRTTDKHIALQCLAVALPIAIVLIVQMAIDARRAATLDESRPLRILAAEARSYYKIFLNGAMDAADTGSLGTRSVDALRSSAGELAGLAIIDGRASVASAAEAVGDLESRISKGATRESLAPLQDRIIRGDVLTKAIDDEYLGRDEQAVREAVDSGTRQKYAVAGALIITIALTALFVLSTRRRLKLRMEDEFAAERRRKAELETLSVRFGVATRAANAGVYEFKGGADVWWSDSMYELYAQSPHAFQPTIASWLELIHPEDREAAQAAISGALRDQSQLRTQYRIVRPDGTVRHVASLAAAATDAFDSSPRLVGIDLDITERVEADERERILQQKLRDSSRQAGMAEIATNVLHNIGNVLNSVNISATLVTDKIRNSKASGLGRVASLLNEHAADLGAFISSERGRQLPVYLAQLSEHLLADQRGTLEELDALRKNIDHIKEIVVMQQSYSKLVGVPERLAVRALVEDALRMNAGAFTRHGVCLKCDFEEVPEVVVEKHKVLQILINLLRNAKYACEATNRPDKQVAIRVANKPDGVSISVTDNGVGIQPEHMTRIFSHGFTTKKDGHGFGLHSGALAAKDMGGALRVDSAGLGQGATFTLELPLKPSEAPGG